MKSPLLLTIILPLAMVVSSHAQTDLGAWLTELQSADPAARQAGFYSIQKSKTPTSSDQVRLALINLLIKEEAYAKQPSGSASEGYGEYFSDVVLAVASLRDTRSIDALVGVIETGNAVADALAAFGPSSLDKVIAARNTPNITTRFASVMVLGKMVFAGTAGDAASVAKIRAALTSASLDPDYNTGRAALQGLLKLFHVSASGTANKVTIDIKPGEYPNVVNPHGDGVISVAIRSSKTFDATTVVSSSVRFGPAQATPTRGGDREDGDHDGLKSLVFHFRTQDAGIVCADTASFLVGKTTSGQVVIGSDAILTVGCRSEGDQDRDGVDQPNKKSQQ